MAIYMEPHGQADAPGADSRPAGRDRFSRSRSTVPAIPYSTPLIVIPLTAAIHKQVCYKGGTNGSTARPTTAGRMVSASFSRCAPTVLVISYFTASKGRLMTGEGQTL